MKRTLILTKLLKRCKTANRTNIEHRTSNFQHRSSCKRTRTNEVPRNWLPKPATKWVLQDEQPLCGTWSRNTRKAKSFTESLVSLRRVHWDNEAVLWHGLRGAGVFAAPPEVSAVPPTSGYCLPTLRV